MFNPTNETTVEFGQQQNYFGLLWSAADRLNVLEFYRDGQFLADYALADFLPHIVTTRPYFGNPSPSLPGDGPEPWIYLNFFGTSGTTFDQVRFKNLPDCCNGTEFETDNHSAGFGAFGLTGTVFQELPEVPEPTTFSLAIAAALWAGVIAARRTLNQLRP